MTDKQLKLTLFKQLGSALLNNGQIMLARAHNVRIIRTITGKELKSFLLGFGFDKVFTADNKYFLTNWKTWESLIRYDFLDQKKYLADARDCDNFADAFSARMSIIYGLNSAGRAKSIDIINPNTKKHKFYHRANLIVAIGESGSLVAYAFEPQTDEFGLIKKELPTIFRNWQYNWGYFEFN